MPSAPGELRRKIVDVDARARASPVKTLPGPARADRRRRQPRRADPAGRRSRTCSAASRSRSTSRRSRAYVRDRVGARHRRRRLDRLGALPPARAARRDAARPRRAGRVGAVRDASASSSTSATSRRRSRCSPTAATRRRCAQVFERYQPAGRLPRRRVQARADARDEPAAGGHEQRARDARDRRGRGRVRRRALRLHLDRQGGEPEEPARPVEGGVRVDRRVVRAAATTSRRASSPCASATCSARPAR